MLHFPQEEVNASGLRHTRPSKDVLESVQARDIIMQYTAEYSAERFAATVAHMQRWLHMLPELCTETHDARAVYHLFKTFDVEGKGFVISTEIMDLTEELDPFPEDILTLRCPLCARV